MKNGMPVFSFLADGIDWQGTCVTISKNEERVYSLVLFDDSSFGDAILTLEISKEDADAISEYTASITVKLMDI